MLFRSCGELVLAEATPDAYKEIGRWALPKNVFWAFPALSDGRLYCRDNDGNVYCVQVGEGPKNAGKKDDSPKPAAQDGAEKKDAPAGDAGADAGVGSNADVATAESAMRDSVIASKQPSDSQASIN